MLSEKVENIATHKRDSGFKADSTVPQNCRCDIAERF